MSSYGSTLWHPARATSERSTKSREFMTTPIYGSRVGDIPLPHEISAFGSCRLGGLVRTSSQILGAGAFAAALLAWSSAARADDLVPSLSIQTGFTFTRTPSPGQTADDYFVAATPALNYYIETSRTLVNVRYAFTGSLNLTLPNGVANNLGVAVSHDLSDRTKLLFGADALQALIGNYLLVRRSADTQFGATPNLNTSVLTLTLSQGVSHELSPTVTFSQGTTGTFVTSLDPDQTFRNYLATATAGISKAYEFDALGGEVNLQGSQSFVPLQRILSRIFTASIGPTWDHDISTRLSSSLAIAAQVAFSPDRGTTPRITPSGRAALNYGYEGSGFGLEYLGGVEPNILFGTLFQAHQVTLRGFTPLSNRYGIVLGASAGYLHAKNVDLGGRGALDNEFDAVLHDADITWPATDFLSIFVRYAFIGQTSGAGNPNAPAGSGSSLGTTPALVRHGALLGIELFASRPEPKTFIPLKFPKRVDKGDSNSGGSRPSFGGKSGGGSSSSSSSAPK